MFQDKFIKIQPLALTWHEKEEDMSTAGRKDQPK